MRWADLFSIEVPQVSGQSWGRERSRAGRAGRAALLLALSLSPPQCLTLGAPSPFPRSQELFSEIEKQRQACEKIIASKDKLILEIKNELKKKDDEFVKTLKRQAEDVDSLLQYMSRQFVEMQNSFKEELDEIENAFLQVGRGTACVAAGMRARTFVWRGCLALINV